MMKFLAVGTGGFLGSMLRYAMTFLPLSVKSGLPVNTLLINFIGSFLLGLISLIAFRSEGSDVYMKLFLTIGLCGGFTTFSTFALENVNLIFAGKHLVALTYILCSIGSCIIGIIAAKMLVDLM